MGQGARCPTCSWISSKVGGRPPRSPAPAVWSHRQADEGPAVRPEEQVRGVVAADPVEGDVGQQEVPRVRLPGEGQAQFVPHPAVRTVAADHVTGADLRLLACGAAEGSGDAVTALAEACQLATLLDRAAELCTRVRRRRSVSDWARFRMNP